MNWGGFFVYSKKKNLCGAPPGVGATEEAKVKQPGLCFPGVYDLKKPCLKTAIMQPGKVSGGKNGLNRLSITARL